MSRNLLSRELTVGFNKHSRLVVELRPQKPLAHFNVASLAQEPILPNGLACIVFCRNALDQAKRAKKSNQHSAHSTTK